jgi:uncharacterized membrane protein (UPF0127 family)
MRRLRITKEDTGTVICVAELAANPWRRMVGLLGRSSLAHGRGLLLRPCSIVHTWFMRFAIDVVFLDRSGMVVRVAHDLAPFSAASGGRAARLTLELPSGTARQFVLKTGDKLRFEPVAQSDPS